MASRPAEEKIAVGSPLRDPDWIHSVNVGAVRLTTRVDSVGAARAEAAAAFAGLQPPAVDAALAVGGSARATRRLVGAWLGPAELVEALHLVESLDPGDMTRRFGVDRSRARVLLGGVAILAEVQQLLGVPLQVGDGGIREGAALLARSALAA